MLHSFIQSLLYNNKKKPKKQKNLMKKTLEPGKEFGCVSIPKDVFVEVEEYQSREQEMQILWMLQLLSDPEKRPKITCSCENSGFLWLLESHRRGKKTDERKEFTFKVQLTCKRCSEARVLDIGPTVECYRKIKKDREAGLRQWSEEIRKHYNDHLKNIRKK
jgi:hypothetical protein